jgi:predicted naringenin-chalcone synthase
VTFADQLRRLKELYKSLTDKLIAKSVAAEMYQRDAVSLKELESIQSKDLCKAAEDLLTILLRRSDNDVSVYECFLEALKITNQHHIFLWISYPGSANIINATTKQLHYC